MKVKTLLFTSVALLGLIAPAAAQTIVDLGVNPPSGAYLNLDPGGVGSGAFTDYYTFSLRGPELRAVIITVTNIFPSPDEFISGFTGFSGGWIARALSCGPGCQQIYIESVLREGDYHLRLIGDAGVNATYDVHLATAAPGPIAGSGLLALLGFGALWRTMRVRGAK